jgi:hypothetical protein
MYINNNMSQYSSPTSDISFQTAVIDQDSLWIMPGALNKLIADLRAQDVSTQAGRAAAAGVLTSLPHGAPYMILDGTALHPTSLRFSTTTNVGVVNPAVVWFALFCDGWDAILSQLTLAVGYRNRAEQKTMLDNGAVLEVDQSRSTPDPSQCRSQSNDAFVSYNRALDTMQRQFRNRIGAYNYKSFENKYALVWSATAPIVLEPDYARFDHPHVTSHYQHPATSGVVYGPGVFDRQTLLKMLAALPDESRKPSGEASGSPPVDSRGSLSSV